MQPDMDFRVTELERRLANCLRVGVVHSADYDQARVRVQSGDLTTAWLPWFTQRAGGDRSWHAPEIGEQVMLLAPSGDLEQAIVLPSIYRSIHPAPAASADVSRTVYGDGLVIEHDRAAKVTRLSALESEGTIVIEAMNLVLRTGEGGTYLVDNHGRASRLTHLGGTDFVSEGYTTGSFVTPLADAGYQPPKVTIPEEGVS